MDDYYFAEYDHKLPIQKITHAVIDGDISLYGVKINRVSVLLTLLHALRYCKPYGHRAFFTTTMSK